MFLYFILYFGANVREFSYMVAIDGGLFFEAVRLNTILIPLHLALLEKRLLASLVVSYVSQR